ncbi:flagellar protein FlaG [Marinobacter sp. MDS2]|uniref:flagellar protein FlaG n=1 Tax=Marinobacter sp. MDS2 TaxID=3065961 RepID=UPI00273C37D6|nr:flagellar protein FlaG [Marinobacter sp. MDS2]MDP4546829.1 flagellar protein FlaG [Marinobacter sp. MDS2]
MNDMKLYGPNMKFVEAAGQVPGTQQVQPVSREIAADSSSVGRAQPTGAEIQPEELGEAVTRLNDYVQNVQRDLQFEVDLERGETIVRVVDSETQEVIRQIPDEVALRLAKNLQHEEPLTLFDIKV